MSHFFVRTVLIIGLLVGPIIGFLIFNADIFSDLIENKRVRLYFISLVSMLPFFSLHIGLTEAHRSINEESGKSIVINNDLEKTYLYVGHAGQYFFLYDSEEEKLIAMSESQVGSFYTIHNDVTNNDQNTEED